MKTVGKCIATLGAVLALALAFAVPSGAQEPYTGVISTTLSRPTMDNCNGTTNTATATGFQPGAVVTFTLNLPSGPVVLGEVEADADGVATLTFTLPAGVEPGTYDLVTTGINSAGVPDEHVITLTVVACGSGGGGSTTTPGTSGDDLARTGSSLTGVVRIGVLVLAAGAVVLLLARRRSTHTV